ncbi:MAG TPA: hypothetical protein VFQ95_03590 [Rhodanobacteraceae bacterium]|nr:hypothetical protein [Rhodanobacteraceae bacterium]
MRLVRAVAIVIVIVAIIVPAKWMRSVPQRIEWMAERFGTHTGTLAPGPHFLVPFIYAIGCKADVTEQVVAVGGPLLEVRAVAA